MNRMTMLAVAVLVSLGAGCERRGGAGTTIADADTGAVARTAGAAPATPAAQAQPDPVEGTALEHAPGQASPGAAIQVTQAGAPKPYLADQAGAALYYMEDNRDGSRCDDTCERAWPPVVASEGQAQAGDGVDGSRLGTLPRVAGGFHVTHDGLALYRYAGDQGPGRTSGDGVRDKWGHWHLARQQSGDSPAR